MSNTTTHLDINRLRERAGEKPRTKVGQVRQVWPEIKTLLSAGHSLKDIWAWLNEIGLDIGYARLSHCIAQLRLQDRAAQLPIQDLTQGLTLVLGEDAGQGQRASQREPFASETHDRLRNILERCGLKGGLEYNPFPRKGSSE